MGRTPSVKSLSFILNTLESNWKTECKEAYIYDDIYLIRLIKPLLTLKENFKRQ